jgi:hypothetical protein
MFKRSSQTTAKAAQSWVRNAIAGTTFLAGVLAYSVASAVDVFVRESGLGAGQASGSLALPVGTGNFWAGLQTISVKASLGAAAATSFVAYCIDPAHYSSSAYTAFSAPSALSAAFSAQAPTIQKLFNEYYAGTLNNNANAAAFQLALWEIADDDGKLSDGAVRTNRSTNSQLVSNADTLLKNLSHLSYLGPNLYDLKVYMVDRSVAGLTGQNYIVATPISEPQSSVLILAGLGLIGFLPGRRRALNDAD